MEIIFCLSVDSLMYFCPENDTKPYLVVRLQFWSSGECGVITSLLLLPIQNVIYELNRCLKIICSW